MTSPRAAATNARKTGKTPTTSSRKVTPTEQGKAGSRRKKAEKGSGLDFIYQQVTQKILTQLEKGVKPWKKQYSGQSWQSPQNYVTKRAYTSINWLMLVMEPYPTPYYLTFKQLSDLAGTVRKGEKGHVVTYWQFPDAQKKADLLAAGRTAAPLMRYYYVWNIAQVDGIRFNLPAAATEPVPTDERFTPLIERMQAEGLKIDNCCPQYPNYGASRDLIQIPPVADFNTPENYYKTLGHEMIHATGHPRRLNRPHIAAHARGEEGTTESRAAEELIAELGTSFVLANLGIDLESRDDLFQNAASYINSWVKLLQNDHRHIFRAAAAAQAAASYLLGNTPEQREPEE